MTASVLAWCTVLAFFTDWAVARELKHKSKRVWLAYETWSCSVNAVVFTAWGVYSPTPNWLQVLCLVYGATQALGVPYTWKMKQEATT